MPLSALTLTAYLLHISKYLQSNPSSQTFTIYSFLHLSELFQELLRRLELSRNVVKAQPRQLMTAKGFKLLPLTPEFSYLFVSCLLKFSRLFQSLTQQSLIVLLLHLFLHRANYRLDTLKGQHKFLSMPGVFHYDQRSKARIHFAKQSVRVEDKE